MRKLLHYAIVVTAFLFTNNTVSSQERKTSDIKFIDIKDVKVNDPFWSPKFKVWSEITATDVLDKFEGKHVHEEGNHNAFCNFDQVAHGDRGTRGHFGEPWFDGLIYESIRGIADYLAQYPDKQMESRIDAYIDRIDAAQQVDPNGYLQTYTDLNEPTHRWGENGGFLRWQHDVYNAGMLIEAGIHYYQATGKPKLLSVATKFANYMAEYMGPYPKKNVVPSHSGPEEAMVKLYWLYKNNPELKKQVNVPVNEKDYWDLVTYWLENRGNHCGYPLWATWGNGEAEKWIKENKYTDPKFGNHSRPTWGDYAQDSISVLDQQTIEGHAVRATLLLTGVATAALENHSPEYIETGKRLWNNMVGQRMFVTGGVGAIHYDEKFGPDYFLPTDAYLETCAAIGAGFFSQRMNELTGKAMYIDELERVIYNSMMTAVSLSGKNYTYQNPLNADHHNRWEWHSCPCCPPMFLKITSALPGYIYSHKDNDIFVNLFMGSETNINIAKNNTVNLKQETRYPWNGAVNIEVNPQKESNFAMKVRIPGWAQGVENPYELYTSNLKDPVTLKVNGKQVDIKLEDGYAVIDRKWKKGDKIELDLPLKPRVIEANPLAENLKNQVVLASGPIIYCFEDSDNSDFQNIKIDPNASLELSYQDNLLDGVNVIKYNGKVKATAIPYYTVSNRGKDTKHKVWLPKN